MSKTTTIEWKTDELGVKYLHINGEEVGFIEKGGSMTFRWTVIGNTLNILETKGTSTFKVTAMLFIENYCLLSLLNQCRDPEPATVSGPAITLAPVPREEVALKVLPTLLSANESQIPGICTGAELCQLAFKIADEFIKVRDDLDTKSQD